MHWAAKYIGCPWEPGARGPGSFDCWGLVMAVYRERLEIELPEFGIDPREKLRTVRAIDAGPSMPCWTKLEKPEEYCVVGMGAGMLSHVGVYLELDQGVVLHAVDKYNVVADKLVDLRSNFRFPRIEFYRHGQHRIR